MNTGNPPGQVTFLFTDIEGSTRLWEEETQRMPHAQARHDALARAAVEDHRGAVVKTMGDGLHAAFADPLDAVRAALQLQRALAEPAATGGIALRVRCGMHAGTVERRDNDYFGSAVNRAARIMSAAHGGQILLSQAVVAAIHERLPEGVTFRDLGVVRLRDLASPERVYQVLHPELRQDFPALRSLEATPNNLPQQVTSFVGRERGLAEVKELLGTTPLLTLLGMGGLGKTRLSLQVAADVMDDYPDGVWFVELAAVADARLVPQAVASVLGVMEEAGRPVVEALVKYVQDRELLVILDNCEHLIHACADLARQLLQAGTGLKLLASSREYLHVPGEATYPVPALALPDPGDALPVDALMQYEAVRLFVDRAMAVQPEFKVTAGNAAALAAICQRLDGIPLAIELAAARVRSLSVEKIAERLTDRFALLTRGNRTDLPRQQTLRALIDWSYDLLDPPEKALFARLSMFAGGFTLEAAEAVGADRETDAAAVLDLLTALVEKSLVELDADGERYRMLETVRQYAQEKLLAAGAEEDARARHLDFYLAFAEEAEIKLRGPDQGAWLLKVAREQENLLVAHALCDRAEDGAARGLTLVWAVQDYWFNRGLLELGHRITVEALRRAGANEPSVERWRALATAGDFCYWLGRYPEAQSYLHECLVIARRTGDRTKIAGVLMLLGRVSHGQGDLAAARGHLEEALQLAREPGGERRLPSALNSLADLYRTEGNLSAAVPLYEESLALRRQQGDGSNIAVNLLSLAMIAVARDTGASARGMVLEALTIAKEIGSKRIGQLVLDLCAALGAFHDDWERAARFYGAAEAQRERMQLHREPVDEVSLAPMIARTHRALAPAAFAAAEVAGRALSYEEALAEARAWLEKGS